MNYLSSLIKVLNHPFNRQQKLKTIARIGWWKCNQWFFHLPSKIQLTDNISILCYPETSFGSYVVYARWPEYLETKFLLDYLRPNDIFLDVGAHLGELSLLAASKITKGKVIAFEPTPTTLNYLKENLTLNNMLDQIIVIPKAASNKVGTAHFILNYESEVNHLKSSGETASRSIKVQTTTIDQELLRYRLNRVSFLKIDVEGAELAVLKGAKKSLAQEKIDVIMLEINPKSELYNHDESLFDFLDRYNYEYYSFNEDGTLSLFNHLNLPSQTINILAIRTALTTKRVKSFIKK